MNGEQFPQRLRRLRTEKKLTQAALAGLCGLHANAIVTHESGQYMPTVKNLCELADFFGVSVEFLLCRTDDPRLERD